ncbi:YbdD/YjiX family protein [Pseudomonas entomophila]|uniref:YbdD/YjiX family protein n=1 Tax=Pseudomonas entomophila TaxID=312306 RepID=UPI0023D8BBE4|nr:YbdD/YjiX family protein [Pseudomonas entomophila]MDF0732143.1 YbdD/YjiX family protein [Pseudomonas entomophila]
MSKPILVRGIQWLRQFSRLTVGMPDYEQYVARRQVSHPGAPVMSYQAFFRERQDARYGKRQCNTRCC